MWSDGILLIVPKKRCVMAWLIIAPTYVNISYKCFLPLLPPYLICCKDVQESLPLKEKFGFYVFLCRSQETLSQGNSKPHPSICCANPCLKTGRSAVQPGQRLCWETFKHEELLPFLWQCLKPFCWQLVFPAIHCRSISFLISKSTWKSSIVSWDRKSFPIVVYAIIFSGCNGFVQHPVVCEHSSVLLEFGHPVLACCPHHSFNSISRGDLKDWSFPLIASCFGIPVLYLIWECLTGSQINLAEEFHRVMEKVVLKR